MPKKQIANGAVHSVPDDLRQALTSTQQVIDQWNSLTPLARNEWICWVESVKKPETRINHIKRTCDELIKRKRRPCCWPGCTHR